MSPRPDVSAERRAQIIQAALACFTRKGYNHTTMDNIVAESGLSKGSLYWYFESKDDLFVSALTSLFADLGQAIVATLEQHATAADKLRAMALELSKFFQSAKGSFNLFVEFWAQDSHREKFGQLRTDMLTQSKEIVVGIIEEGISNGEFRPVDTDQLAWAMMAAYDGLAIYITLIPAIDMERVSQVFVETLLSGLEAGERGSDTSG